MTDDPTDQPPGPTRNERWTRILLAADTDVIHPREAIVAAQEHYEAVYGTNFKAAILMLEELDRAIRETRERATANTANSTLILEHLQRAAQWQDRQEAAVLGLRADFQSLGERLDGIEVRTADLEAAIRARDDRSNRVQERIAANSERIEAIDRFIQQFAALPTEVRDLRGAVEDLTRRMDTSERDRQDMRAELAEIKRLVGGDD